MNPQNNSFVLKPDGKIYWVKDMPENKCLDEPGYGLYKQALQSAIDNAVEVSNQQEIFERLHGIAYPLNLKKGTVYSLLCSVEKFERCTIVEMGPTATRKELALVTFPESGEKQSQEQLDMLNFIIHNYCSMEGHNIVNKEKFLKTFTITRK
jgi:hypothetical protein